MKTALQFLTPVLFIALLSTTALAREHEVGHGKDQGDDCDPDRRGKKGDGRDRDGVDFVVSEDVLRSSLTTHWIFVTPWSQDYRRGCVFHMGFRHVLRFNTRIVNQGNRDFELGEPPAPEWVKYSFLRVDGTEAIPLRHQSLVMKDDHQIVGDRPGKYDYHFQGLTAGWANDHPAKAHCQLFDITELNSGTYLIEIEVNPDREFEESNYCNNKTRTIVELR